MSWWVKCQGLGNFSHAKVANIYYQDDVTPEEVERIRMQDEVEMLADKMESMPGYGLVHKGRSAFGTGQ